MMRSIVLYSLLIPAMGFSCDNCPKEAQKKSWTLRSLALPTVGAAVGALTVWGLSRQKVTRSPIEFSASMYIKGSIAGFGFGFAIDNLTYKSSTESKSAHTKPKNLPKPSSGNGKIPPKPRELDNYPEEDYFYSSKWKRWVVFIKTEKDHEDES